MFFFSWKRKKSKNTYFTTGNEEWFEKVRRWVSWSKSILVVVFTQETNAKQRRGKVATKENWYFTQKKKKNWYFANDTCFVYLFIFLVKANIVKSILGSVFFVVKEWKSFFFFWSCYMNLIYNIIDLKKRIVFFLKSKKKKKELL